MAKKHYRISGSGDIKFEAAFFPDEKGSMTNIKCEYPGKLRDTLVARGWGASDYMRGCWLYAPIEKIKEECDFVRSSGWRLREFFSPLLDKRP